MSGNSFGHQFKIHTFGESHGVALGAVIDGCPAGLVFDEKVLSHELERRRPGSSDQVSARAESDKPEVLSGVFQGKTLGTPIAIMTRNHDAKSSDYESVKNSPRAGHADDVWRDKFLHSDYRGGGRSSGRETVARVMGGAVAKMLLAQIAPNLKIKAFAHQIGPHKLNLQDETEFLESNKAIDEFPMRFPSAIAGQVQSELVKLKAQGDSWGGIVKVVIQNAPKNLGQPVFNKIKADLAQALMSLGATSGIEFGSGFSAADASGVRFHHSTSAVYGGIRGGITTGEEIHLRLAFKPTSSILDVAKQGRHDPCILIRALPVVEAMINLVLVDHFLLAKLDRI